MGGQPSKEPRPSLWTNYYKYTSDHSIEAIRKILSKLSSPHSSPQELQIAYQKAFVAYHKQTEKFAIKLFEKYSVDKKSIGLSAIAYIVRDSAIFYYQHSDILVQGILRQVIRHVIKTCRKIAKQHKVTIDIGLLSKWITNRMRVIIHQVLAHAYRVLPIMVNLPHLFARLIIQRVYDLKLAAPLFKSSSSTPIVSFSNDGVAVGLGYPRTLNAGGPSHSAPGDPSDPHTRHLKRRASKKSHHHPDMSQGMDSSQQQQQQQQPQQQQQQQQHQNGGQVGRSQTPAYTKDGTPIAAFYDYVGDDENDLWSLPSQRRGSSSSSASASSSTSSFSESSSLRASLSYTATDRHRLSPPNNPKQTPTLLPDTDYPVGCLVPDPASLPSYHPQPYPWMSHQQQGGENKSTLAYRHRHFSDLYSLLYGKKAPLFFLHTMLSATQSHMSLPPIHKYKEGFRPTPQQPRYPYGPFSFTRNTTESKQAGQPFPWSHASGALDGQTTMQSNTNSAQGVSTTQQKQKASIAYLFFAVMMSNSAMVPVERDNLLALVAKKIQTSPYSIYSELVLKGYLPPPRKQRRASVKSQKPTIQAHPPTAPKKGSTQRLSTTQTIRSKSPSDPSDTPVPQPQGVIPLNRTGAIIYASSQLCQLYKSGRLHIAPSHRKRIFQSSFYRKSLTSSSPPQSQTMYHIKTPQGKKIVMEIPFPAKHIALRELIYPQHYRTHYGRLLMGDTDHQQQKQSTPYPFMDYDHISRPISPFLSPHAPVDRSQLDTIPQIPTRFPLYSLIRKSSPTIPTRQNVGGNISTEFNPSPYQPHTQIPLASLQQQFSPYQPVPTTAYVQKLPSHLPFAADNTPIEASALWAPSSSAPVESFLADEGWRPTTAQSQNYGKLQPPHHHSFLPSPLVSPYPSTSTFNGILSPLSPHIHRVFVLHHVFMASPQIHDAFLSQQRALQQQYAYQLAHLTQRHRSFDDKNHTDIDSFPTAAGAWLMSSTALQQSLLSTYLGYQNHLNANHHSSSFLPQPTGSTSMENMCYPSPGFEDELIPELNLAAKPSVRLAPTESPPQVDTPQHYSLLPTHDAHYNNNNNNNNIGSTTSAPPLSDDSHHPKPPLHLLSQISLVPPPLDDAMASQQEVLQSGQQVQPLHLNVPLMPHYTSISGSHLQNQALTLLEQETSSYIHQQNTKDYNSSKSPRNRQIIAAIPWWKQLQHGVPCWNGGVLPNKSPMHTMISTFLSPIKSMYEASHPTPSLARPIGTFIDALPWLDALLPVNTVNTTNTTPIKAASSRHSKDTLTGKRLSLARKKHWFKRQLHALGYTYETLEKGFLQTLATPTTSTLQSETNWLAGNHNFSPVDTTPPIQPRTTRAKSLHTNVFGSKPTHIDDHKSTTAGYKPAEHALMVERSSSGGFSTLRGDHAHTGLYSDHSRDTDGHSIFSNDQEPIKPLLTPSTLTVQYSGSTSTTFHTAPLYSSTRPVARSPTMSGANAPVSRPESLHGSPLQTALLTNHRSRDSHQPTTQLGRNSTSGSIVQPIEGLTNHHPKSTAAHTPGEASIPPPAGRQRGSSLSSTPQAPPAALKPPQMKRKTSFLSPLLSRRSSTSASEKKPQQHPPQDTNASTARRSSLASDTLTTGSMIQKDEIHVGQQSYPAFLSKSDFVHFFILAHLQVLDTLGFTLFFPLSRKYSVYKRQEMQLTSLIGQHDGQDATPSLAAIRRAHTLQQSYNTAIDALIKDPHRLNALVGPGYSPHTISPSTQLSSQLQLQLYQQQQQQQPQTQSTVDEEDEVKEEEEDGYSSTPVLVPYQPSTIPSDITPIIRHTRSKVANVGEPSTSHMTSSPQHAATLLLSPPPPSRSSMANPFAQPTARRLLIKSPLSDQRNTDDSAPTLRRLYRRPKDSVGVGMMAISPDRPRPPPTPPLVMGEHAGMSPSQPPPPHRLSTSPPPPPFRPSISMNNSSQSPMKHAGHTGELLPSLIILPPQSSPTALSKSLSSLTKSISASTTSTKSQLSTHDYSKSNQKLQGYRQQHQQPGTPSTQNNNNNNSNNSTESDLETANKSVKVVTMIGVRPTKIVTPSAKLSSLTKTISSVSPQQPISLANTPSPHMSPPPQTLRENMYRNSLGSASPSCSIPTEMARVSTPPENGIRTMLTTTDHEPMSNIITYKQIKKAAIPVASTQQQSGSVIAKMYDPITRRTKRVRVTPIRTLKQSADPHFIEGNPMEPNPTPTMTISPGHLQALLSSGITVHAGGQPPSNLLDEHEHHHHHHQHMEQTQAGEGVRAHQSGIRRIIRRKIPKDDHACGMASSARYPLVTKLISQHDDAETGVSSHRCPQQQHSTTPPPIPTTIRSPSLSSPLPVCHPPLHHQIPLVPLTVHTSRTTPTPGESSAPVPPSRSNHHAQKPSNNHTNTSTNTSTNNKYTFSLPSTEQSSPAFKRIYTSIHQYLDQLPSRTIPSFISIFAISRSVQSTILDAIPQWYSVQGNAYKDGVFVIAQPLPRSSHQTAASQRIPQLMLCSLGNPLMVLAPQQNYYSNIIQSSSKSLAYYESHHPHMSSSIISALVHTITLWCCQMMSKPPSVRDHQHNRPHFDVIDGTPQSYNTFNVNMGLLSSLPPPPQPRPPAMIFLSPVDKQRLFYALTQAFTFANPSPPVIPVSPQPNYTSPYPPQQFQSPFPQLVLKTRCASYVPHTQSQSLYQTYYTNFVFLFTLLTFTMQPKMSSRHHHHPIPPPQLDGFPASVHFRSLLFLAQSIRELHEEGSPVSPIHPPPPSGALPPAKPTPTIKRI